MGRKGPRWRRPLEKQGQGQDAGRSRRGCLHRRHFFTLYHTSRFQPAAGIRQGQGGQGPPPQLPGFRVSQELMGLPLPTS